MKRLLTVLLVLVLSLTALTVQAQTYDPAALATYFPENTDVYIGIRIDDGYIETLDGVLARILGKPPPQLQEQIPQITLRQALLSNLPSSITYDDIRQWLGDYAALGTTNATVTMDDDSTNDDDALMYVAATITDKAALEAFIVEQVPEFADAEATTSGDFTVYTAPDGSEGLVAINNEVVLFTNASELPAGGLNNSASFGSTVEKMPADSYNIFMYINSAVFATAAQANMPPMMDENPLETLNIDPAALNPTAIGLTVLDGRSLTIDILSPGLPGIMPTMTPLDPAFASLIPADTSYVIHVTNPGGSLSTLLELAATASQESDNPMTVEQISNLFNGLTGLDLEEDVLSWMSGDMALIMDTDVPGLLGNMMTGTLDELPLSFGVLVETGGSDRPAAVVQALARILQNQADEEEVTVTNETINGVDAVVLTGEAEGLSVPLEIVIGASDSLFVIATRPLAEQLFSGDYAGLDTSAAYQEASAYILPNSGAVLYTDNGLVGDLVTGVLFFGISSSSSSSSGSTSDMDDATQMMQFAYDLVSSASISSTMLDSGDTLTRAVVTLAN